MDRYLKFIPIFLLAFAIMIVLFLAMEGADAQEAQPPNSLKVTIVSKTAKGVVVKTEVVGAIQTPSQCAQAIKLFVKTHNELPLPFFKMAATCEPN